MVPDCLFSKVNVENESGIYFRDQTHSKRGRSLLHSTKALYISMHSRSFCQRHSILRGLKRETSNFQFQTQQFLLIKLLLSTQLLALQCLYASKIKAVIAMRRRDGQVLYSVNKSIVIDNNSSGWMEQDVCWWKSQTATGTKGSKQSKCLTLVLPKC